jgi:hypothetical protein
MLKTFQDQIDAGGGQNEEVRTTTLGFLFH